MLKEDKISEIKQKIIDAVHPEKIILFGSYVTGEAMEESDIDLVVIWDFPASSHQRNMKIRRLFPHRDFSLDVFVFTPQEEMKYKDVKGTICILPLQKGKCFMNENKMTIVKRWFSKGDNDLKNIQNNLESEDIPTDTICFHAQQAIDKYIKGALVYFDQDISKAHDLVKLLTEIASFIPELSVMEEDLEKITEFAVEVRYPDSFYDHSLEEAKGAYEIALKVKDIVLSKVPVDLSSRGVTG